MKKLHTELDLEGASDYTLIIGISARNLRGLVFLWSHILSFIFSTKKAEGCLAVLPGISGPFQALLVSYWDSEENLKAFVRSRAHVKWMQYIYRHPQSLDLFNETYSAPLRANFINHPRGYAHGALAAKERERKVKVG